MKFTIRRKSDSLCENCSHSLRAHDTHGRLLISQCTAFGAENVHVRGDVAKCKSYSFRYSDDWQFREKAWILQVSKTREFMGFRPPKKDKDEE